MSSQTAGAKAVAGLANFLDERLGISKIAKNVRKTFPDHWSFMLGEVALYSFVILLLSGVFLTFFYVPSVTPVRYGGEYAPLAGKEMSEAFASTVRLSFDVRGGLLMRQVHHWSALIFVSAIVVHMFRVFFTGAFRKPREINWVLGATLALLAMFEGFAGYSLPDDLLSGTGLRIASGIILSIPVIGSYISFFLFGGEFPGEIFIPRLYTIHVLLLPAIFLALIVVHLAFVILHKHAQYPGPARTNDNVVGYPLMPVYMAKAGGFFFIVFGIIALMSAVFTINPIWAYGAYDPSPVTAGSQPDWYMGWLDGLVRLTPGWFEFTLGGFTFSMNIFIPTLLIIGIISVLLFGYPWIEAWVTGDRREHHLLDRPRNMPTRTALGVMAITFYLLALVSGGNDIVATHLRLSINDITNTLRLVIFIGPWFAYMITKRICLGLQRRDRDKALHGRETGRVVRLPHGEYIEVHEPVSAENLWVLVQHERMRPLELESATDANRVGRPSKRFEGARRRMSHFYFEDRIEPVTPGELEEALHGHGHGGDGHDAVDGGHADTAPAVTSGTSGHH